MFDSLIRIAAIATHFASVSFRKEGCHCKIKVQCLGMKEGGGKREKERKKNLTFHSRKINAFEYLSTLFSFKSLSEHSTLVPNDDKTNVTFDISIYSEPSMTEYNVALSF